MDYARSHTVRMRPNATGCIAHRARQQARTLFGAIFMVPYLAISGAKSVTSYSCSATWISYKGDEIWCLSRLVFENWRGTDRQTDRQTTEAATETEGSHTVSVRVVSCNSSR